MHHDANALNASRPTTPNASRVGSRSRAGAPATRSPDALAAPEPTTPNAPATLARTVPTRTGAPIGAERARTAHDATCSALAARAACNLSHGSPARPTLHHDDADPLARRGTTTPTTGAAHGSRASGRADDADRSRDGSRASGRADDADPRSRVTAPARSRTGEPLHHDADPRSRTGEPLHHDADDADPRSRRTGEPEASRLRPYITDARAENKVAGDGSPA